MLTDALHRDAIEELGVLVVVAPLAGDLGLLGLGCRGYEQPGERGADDEASEPATTSRWITVEHDGRVPPLLKLSRGGSGRRDER